MLLSCLRKTFEKVLAKTLATAERLLGATTNEQFGFVEKRSSIDALMINTTRAQGWMRDNMQYKKHTVRPTIMGNDIDGAFNYVNHDQPIAILNHYKFPKRLVNSIKNFNTNRTVHLAFEGTTEAPAPFSSGVPQRSLISPVQFVIYAADLSAPGPTPPHHRTTSYVDDEIMCQGAPTQKEASSILQKRLDQRIERPRTLNIRFPAKTSEIMHIIAHQRKIGGTDDKDVTLYDTRVTLKDSMKRLGV